MLTVYGIPTCGTVKKARAWLDAQGVTHRFVDFRTNPPDRTQIDAWVGHFGAKALRNTSGGSYRALGSEKAEFSDATWAEHFHADPMLIKRPVITRGESPLLVGFRGSDDQIKAALALS